MKPHFFRAALFTLALVLPVQAVDYYFNSDTRRIERPDGSPYSPQAVAGINATLTAGLPGVIAADGAVEFTFPASLNLTSTDIIGIVRGVRPVRIIVAGTVTIPAGARVEAPGLGPGTSGGAGGSGLNSGGFLGRGAPGVFGGAGGLGGTPSVGGPATPGQAGAAGGASEPGRAGAAGNDGISRAGADGFNQPGSGAPAAGRAVGGAGGAAGFNYTLRAPGGAAGGFFGSGYDGQNGYDGYDGKPGARGANGLPGTGGRYANPARKLMGGGGGASGSGGGGGGGGGSGSSGAGGGGGGSSGLYSSFEIFEGPDDLLGRPAYTQGTRGGNGGRGGESGSGGFGTDGGNGGAGGGAFEIRATGLITIGGIVSANGQAGAASTGLPEAGENGGNGSSGEGRMQAPDKPGYPDGGSGGAAGDGGNGARGGAGGVGGPGGGGAGGTIILNSGVGIVKLPTAIVEARGGASPGAAPGAPGGVFEIVPAGLLGLEDFSYTPGTSLVGQSGGSLFDWNNLTRVATGTRSAWTGVFGTAPTTTANRTLITNSQGVRRAYGANETDGAFRNTGTVYYKIEMTREASAAWSGVSTFDFGTERVFFGIPDTVEPVTGQRRFAIKNVPTGATTYSTLQPVTGRRYTLVAKVDFDQDLLSLWVDPKLGQPEAENPPLATLPHTETNFSTSVRVASVGAAEWDNLALAATWESLAVTVTTPADEDSGVLSAVTGAGTSLREAVKYARAGSLITFAPHLSGTTLALGSELLVNRNLSIDAGDLPQGVTLSGGSNGDAFLQAGETRHFNVQNGANLRLTALTLVDGMSDDSGGSILHLDSELTIERCLFRRNRALNFGGAIRHQGGSLTLRHSTLVENFADGEGGAIDTDSPTAAITHCTITGNQASTGGGINRFNSALVLTASIVAENIATSANSDISGPFTNVESLVGGDPKLSPLGSYGGPTLTRVPLVGSPAIDAVTTANLGFFDQRGLPRRMDGDANGSVLGDCGAVEAGALLRVNSLADNGGNFDLRTLLNATAIFPGARIGFEPSLFDAGAIITLAQGQLTVPATASGVMIDASNLANAPTINAAGLSRVLEVPENAAAAIWNVKFTGGRVPASGSIREGGGGLLNQGSLTLHRATITGNHAGTYGGGLANTGQLMMFDSTLANNGLPGPGEATHHGGGLVTVGSALLERCTVSRNAAEYNGGGIDRTAGALTLRNVTIANNVCGFNGGGIAQVGAEPSTLEFVTLAGNRSNRGGGVAALNSPVSLRGCVIAGNSATLEGPDVLQGQPGNITTVGSNLIGNNTDSGLAAAPPLIGTAAAPVLARLSPLANYGGPTATMLPLVGSPAIGGAGSGGIQIDQRGRLRSFPVDLGATEDTLGDSFAVTTMADAGAGSLRQRLLDAPSGSLIVLDPAVFTGGAANRIALTSALIAPAGKSVTIDASLVGGLTLDAGGTGLRVLEVPDGATFTLKGATLRGGGSNFGGAVHNAGHLTLERCTLTENRSGNRSGAIENDTSGTLMLDRCTITANHAIGDAGALFNFGTATFLACTVTENACTNNGGAIFNVGTLSLGSTIVARNNHGSVIDHDDLRGGGTVVTQGGNLIGENTDFSTVFPAGLPNANGDFVGTFAAPLDPQLSPLAPRGGPTETMPPLPGSPALDRAPGTLAETDQRGFPRIVATVAGTPAQADIGAVERGPVILVTHSDDAGPGSLRATLAAATAPDTRLIFDSSLDGETITLTSATLTVQAGQNVEIDASPLPRGITLSGDKARRVISNLGIASLHRLKLRDGFSNAGSGIGFLGAAGLFSSGSLLAVDCAFTGNSTTFNGGGLGLSGGTTHLLRCTMAENTALDAGGIALTGTGRTTLTNCTVAENRCTGSDSTGGMSISGGTLALRHTTLAQNVGNGGGGGLFLLSPATVSVEHCLIAGNRDLAGPQADIYQLSGTLTAAGPSFIGSNESVSAQFPPGPLVGTAAAPLDPRLGPLAPRGAYTSTMPPLTGSAAIDAAGSPPSLLVDQRGFPRPLSGQADLGAAERGPLLIVTNTSDAGAGSLRDTLAAATEPDTRILFADGLDNQTITLTSESLTVQASQSVELDATALSRGISVSGSGARRVFFNLGALTLHRLGVRNGSAPDGGAGVLSFGPLVAVECAFTGHTTNQTGAGIFVIDGALDLHRCTISGNTARDAAGLYLQSSERAFLSNCTIADNRSTGTDNGSTGGLAAVNGPVTLRHCTVTQNTGRGNGGGLFLQVPAAVSLERSLIAANRDSASARADIAVLDGTLTPVGANFLGSNEGVAALFPVGPLVGSSVTPLAPGLALLGDYGGLTFTAPPIPGSPVIDAATGSTTNFDQRGFSRSGTADLGAAEFRGAADVRGYWFSDWDGDGQLFGIEHALGTDPLLSDHGNPRNLTHPTFNGLGSTELTFGVNSSFTPGTKWILRRSTDLVNFTEIFRFDGTSFASNDMQVDVVNNGTSLTVIDRFPPVGKCFYRFEAEMP